MNCTCMNGATCNPISGQCHCTSGYRGDTCEKTCKEGTYGDGCKQVCLCENGAKCNPVDGTCNCTENWTGKYCNEEEACSSQWEFLSGGKCTPCYCNPDNAVSCDAYGQCICNAGWASPNCTEREEITKSSGGNNILLVTGIVAGICCLLLVLVFYFVRRYQKRRNGFSNSWLEMSSVSDTEDDTDDGLFSRLRRRFTNARKYDGMLNVQVSNKDISATSVSNRRAGKNRVVALSSSPSDDSSMSDSDEGVQQDPRKPSFVNKNLGSRPARQQRTTYASID